MDSDYSGVTSLPRGDGRHASSAVHKHLRALILSGDIKPGTLLNQVELAPLLGVSRTPLREAIRMLQREDLVDAEPQKRARVKEFDVDRLEAVYTQRILLEGLAARLTAHAASDEEVAELERVLGRMKELGKDRDLEEWQAHHLQFHRLLIAAMNPPTTAAIESLMDRGEHYRFVYQVSGPRAWAAGAAEHERILDAYRERDGVLAAQRLSTHLARTALSIIVQVAPEHDPLVLREALALHAAPAPPADILEDGELHRRDLARAR